MRFALLASALDLAACSSSATSGASWFDSGPASADVSRADARDACNLLTRRCFCPDGTESRLDMCRAAVCLCDGHMGPPDAGFDAGQADAGTPDAGVKVGTLDAGAADVDADAGPSDTESDVPAAKAD